MTEHVVVNIDDETIKKIGLRLSEKRLNAETAIESRVFEYPHLENVFIMESDIYMETPCRKIPVSLLSMATMV